MTGKSPRISRCSMARDFAARGAARTGLCARTVGLFTS
jgi:hypothetical protein